MNTAGIPLCDALEALSTSGDDWGSVGGTRGGDASRNGHRRSRAIAAAGYPTRKAAGNNKKTTMREILSNILDLFGNPVDYLLTCG